jgi:hypothetical protein
LKELFKNDKFRFALLMAGVLLSRLPFLPDGYGLDGDSWSVAFSALQLCETGVYEVSRLPGYPVHEFLTSMVIGGGPFAVNLLTAIFSMIGIAAFFHTLRTLRFKKPYLASIAFAAVPVFYIHSTTAIDYNFALAFILSSGLFVLKERYVLAGILLGFAIGCRITSGAMLIPFAILVVQNDGIKASLKRILSISIPSVITGLILFYPVISDHGFGFFMHYDVPYPSIPKVLYKFSIEVWGIAGLFGLMISIGILFLSNRSIKRQYLFPRSVNERYVIAWLVAIDLYIIAFLKLPMESGYLIPLVPFVIMLFGKYLYDKAFVFLCIMLILSPFILSLGPVDRLDAGTPSKASFSFKSSGEHLRCDLLKGPVPAYKSRRLNGLELTRSVLESADTLKHNSVLVSGRWYAQLMVQNRDSVRSRLIFKSYLNENEAVYYFAKGYEIYYMPRQDYYNKIMRGIDLTIYGAEPFLDKEAY